MNIEVNRDLDRFKESVILGLSLKQLIYSAIALSAGAGIVLLVYPYVGLTMAAYITVPVVAPIALTGFYSFHGMTFVEMMRLRFQFTGRQPTLHYESTEDDEELERLLREETELLRKNNKKTAADRILAKKQKKEEKKSGRKRKGANGA
ncbi:MAG: PrgI family protein [Eubacterium sp.]|nr:PrgI family protein [Eubacterium sp.]